MPNTKTKLAFKGTPEQKAELLSFIEEHKDMQGFTMPVLQKAQELYGYLPEEVQVIIAEATGIPLVELYGIATFYSQFSLNPKGENRVSVCMGTACYVKGAGDVLKKVEDILKCAANSVSEDGKYSVDATRCVGACGLAPVVMVNDEVFGKVTVAQVVDILKKIQ